MRTRRQRAGPTPASLLLCLLAAACAIGSGAPARYSGSAPACGRSEGGGITATLTRSGSDFALAPYDGSLIVDGTVAANGAVAGTLVLHPAQTSAGAGRARTGAAQTLSVSGRLSRDAASLAYVAPGCAASLTLTRVRPPVF